MPAATIHTARVFEDGGAQCMARVVGNAGANITQASLTGITYVITNLRTRAEVTASTALTVADVVFDALQTDARWTEDSTGYNFRHTVTAAELADGDTLYRVEYLFDPTSGEDFVVAFDLSTENLLRS